MQAYGGSLFDPDRSPFLEGRAAGSQWRSTPAEPLSVNNRVVLHLLNSLQRLRTKVGAGRTAETRRVSFRALGVEQIGHVYEGLLDHTAFRADEVVLGIRGTRSKEPEIALDTLESLLAQGEDKLIEHLKEETGRSVSALRRELNDGGLLDEHKLLIACDQDDALLARLRPFAGLIRDDSFDRPWVVLPGSVFVTVGTARRSTGTHYTPPSLTEPIVQHTLEPLVYVGPAEGTPREQWQLKSPKEILDLKVCDMAMGSGAFLVQACRYLAERLVEAWENEEKRHPGQVLITPDGKFSEGSPSERLVPAEAAERIAIARRVVADRCLYGVDINPMAVEMAKLSMWLITVDANRPFTFLDHAFKCGDSLLGITSLEQLENFSLRPGGGKQQGFGTLNFRRHIEEAKKKREALEDMPSDTPEQIAAKAALYADAEDAVAKLNAAANVLMAVELKELKSRNYESERQASADLMMASWTKGLPELLNFANLRLGVRRAFHWPIHFPEVFSHGGFDSFVGNPPFLGSRQIAEEYGKDYASHLLLNTPNAHGNADFVAYFFRRVGTLLNQNRTCGLIATKSISESDTRISSLSYLTANGFCIFRCITSMPWPGQATVKVAVVFLIRGTWPIFHCNLDGQLVREINSTLQPSAELRPPVALEANGGMAFIGAKILGQGFLLSLDEAETLVSRNLCNAEIIKPYIGGDDISSSPSGQSKRVVIAFGNRSLEDASAWPDLLSIVEKKVKPERMSAKDHPLGAHGKKYWWQFGSRVERMQAAIAKFDVCLVISRVSKYVALRFSSTTNVFSEAVIVFATDSHSAFSFLESAIHEAWVLERASFLGDTIRYTPTDCFETFPTPIDWQTLSKTDTAGRAYYALRDQICENSNLGVTKTYNSYHNPSVIDNDIAELRRLHVEMDNAVAAAYGWQDLNLDYGFHETKQGIRYTISEAARREILDRLLALNHQRHAEEEAEKAALPVSASAKRGRKLKDTGGQITMDL